MKKNLLIFLFISMRAMAQPSGPDYTASAIESSKSWIDADYVGDGITGHHLDILLPKTGHGPYPVVVCIYGSAWFGNNLKGNTFTTGLGQRLLKEGFAVVSINYRSSHDAKFPAQIQDTKAAIRFIRANSKSFSLDSHFVAITGWSSGGHLAAMCGTTNGTQSTNINGLTVDIEGRLGKNLGQSSGVDAVIDWFGPTDFLIMDQCGSSMKHDDPNSPESSLVGGPIQDNKDKVALANPISYVNKSNPPFLIFHGDKDPLVPHCQSEKLYERLRKAGVQAELVLVPGGQHGPGVMIDKYYDQMISFLQSQMRLRAKK
jgi:acetyl esterase/lipase